MRKKEIKDKLYLSGTVFILIISFYLTGIIVGPLASSAQETNTPEPGKYYTLNKVVLSDGAAIDEIIIIGPPVPPPGFEIERLKVSLPKPDSAAGIQTLTVPAFNWVLGCSAVSGAMIAGYYDQTGFPNMYAGPTNGGVMPMNNSSWPTWSDGYSTYPSCPLIASKNGVDGRATRGSIDDYWVKYNSNVPDPYITNNWTEHTWGDAIGDYMKTSQSAFDNVDGSTMFYNWSSAARLTCADMVTYGIHTQDGTYGRKLFYEARGYTVTDCYNQKTDNTIAGGFSFVQFKAEIDADRPVMLNLAGHTVVGVGYDDSSNLVYIHDTWDYNNHTMTWGGSYSGMALQSVSIVNLQQACADTTPDAFTFTDRTNAELSTVATSSQITVGGICAPAAISISGGTYSINSGGYTAAAGTVSNGDIVTVRQTSSGSYSTTTNAVLTIGGVSDTFSVTTKAQTYTVSFSFTGGGTITCTPTSVSSGGSFACTVFQGSGYHLQSLIDNTADVTGSVFNDLYSVINVTANHDVTATFQQNTLVLRLSGAVEPYSESWYSLIQEAYNASSDTDDILMQAADFYEDLDLDRDISVMLRGGYNADFNSAAGFTTIHGSLTIGRGTVLIDKLIIQ